ncbi:MAG TPA: Ig-like domain-containing protein, partial [Clostridia bacterium]|nr:Ig-like domain-containing protein [Clostridia bacterium]
LIASVVLLTQIQGPPGSDQIVITSPIADAHAVQLQQPILVKFNQPMNHASTESAVQITPATYVAFSWSANTLAVQPTSGNLAPNTQYQVTIGPGAKTQSGQRLASPTTITFVTQPSVTPAPTPTPTVRATPNPAVTGERRLAPVPSNPFYVPQWSADSTTIYLVGANGGLESVTVADGGVKVLVPDGVSEPAIAPAGDRLAYVRGGKIEILTLADGTTAELTAPSQLMALGWAKDQLLLGAKDGVYTADAQGPIQVASIPPDSIGIMSIAPDGAHAIYEGATHSLFVLDITTSRSTQLGTVSGASFLGWSPDGLRLLYSGPDGTVVADDQGETIATLLSGEPSWSSQDEILLGNDTNLYAVRPDGFGLTKLTSGTYHLPVWAPNGTAFAFVRGGAIWTANVTPLPAEPSALAQADSVVDSFMTARLQGQANLASALLDAKGKQAYSAGGLPLLITGAATFSRYYVLTQEITGANPDTATFVVRLVLTKDKLDVSDFEETLTLQRDNASQPFLIDQATASQPRDLGKGAEVVSVDVASGSIKVVFDSDLVTNTVTDGVVLLDATGKQVGDASTYTNRTVTITGLQLVPGAAYKLVVMTTVQDVGGRNVPTEYDLNLIGPAAGTNGGGSAGGNVNSPPSPAPSPIPTPSPTETPAP